MLRADGKLYLPADVQLGLITQIPASVMRVTDRDNCELEFTTGLNKRLRLCSTAVP